MRKMYKFFIIFFAMMSFVSVFAQDRSIEGTYFSDDAAWVIHLINETTLSMENNNSGIEPETFFKKSGKWEQYISKRSKELGYDNPMTIEFVGNKMIVKGISLEGEAFTSKYTKK